MDTDSVTDIESLPRVLGHTGEGELSDIEQDVSLTDADQALSEEQNYRESMRRIRSFMGWSHIPHVDSALSSSEDDPFAAPKQQASKNNLNYRLGQTIQTEWSLLPEVFQAIYNRWHRPQIDLFATRFNNKLTHFMSPVPDPQA